MSLAKDKPYYPNPSDYEDDVHSWAFEQAQLLRLGRFSEVDLPNVIEELESLGREIEIQLETAYCDLIAGLLEWNAAPENRTIELSKTIRNARFSIRQEERDSKSLRDRAKAIVHEVYSQSVRQAMIATGRPRSDFPIACPYELDFLRNPDSFPGDAD